jgi:hypothetical protein
VSRKASRPTFPGVDRRRRAVQTEGTKAGKTTLSLTLTKGHLLVEVGGRFALLDTGSPVSFGRGHDVTIGGRTHECAVHPSIGFGVGTRLLDYLEEWLEVPELEWLVGMDFLGQHRMTVNIPAGKLTFEDSISLPGAPISTLTTPFGEAYPRVEVEIAGQRREALFDTGAWLNYVPGDLLEGRDRVATMRDFLPGFGEFTTPVYEVTVGIEGAPPQEVRAGILPAGEFTFIIGTELLRHQVASFDFPAKRLRWLPVAA